MVTHTELTRALCLCAASLQAVATPAQPDPLGTLLNQNTNYANIIAGAHPDPIPNNLVNLLVENPLGPQLDAAFKALPSLQVRTSPIAELQILSFLREGKVVSPSRLCMHGIMPARSRLCYTSLTRHHPAMPSPHIVSRAAFLCAPLDKHAFSAS